MWGQGCVLGEAGNWFSSDTKLTSQKLYILIGKERWTRTAELGPSHIVPQASQRAASSAAGAGRWHRGCSGPGGTGEHVVPTELRPTAAYGNEGRWSRTWDSSGSWGTGLPVKSSTNAAF